MLKPRQRIKIASKIIDEYEHCQEYTPRMKKTENSKLQKNSSINDEMQVESITEEEATKIVVEGTHEYPSGPGKSSFSLIDEIGMPVSDTRTEPSASAIDLAVKTLKEKERQQKFEF